METREEKQRFLKAFDSFFATDFEPIDLVNFVLQHKMAQNLLLEFGCCDYSEEIEFITNNDMYNIESILENSHLAYYDSEYGSQDPIPSFRLCKKDFEECKNHKDVLNGDYDNILSHMLDALFEDEESNDL